MGKELERQLTPDEIALREIQGYIDKVERQVETQQPQLIKPQQSVVAPQTAAVAGSQGVNTIVPVITKQKITLPLDQADVESGLKRSVADGIRWLSEWCVMMIKKYPGRVFYLPQSTSK